MPNQDERGAVFLTAPPEVGARIIENVRTRFPTTRWTLYLRANDASALASVLDGVEVISDKPTGSKIAFLRDIRRNRFDLAVIAWTGDRSHNKMKMVGLLGAARRYLIYNENIDSFYLDSHDGIWWRHLRWRASGGLALMPALMSSAIGLYKWTLGLVIGGSWLVGRLAIRRLRMRWAAAHAN